MKMRVNLPSIIKAASLRVQRGNPGSMSNRASKPGLPRCARNDGFRFARNDNDGYATKIVMSILLIFALMTSAITFAKLPDDSQPLSIKSDEFHYDNQNGVATYTGNVLATQGTRRLTGDRLEIYRNSETGKIERIIVKGSPAYYEGLTELDKPPLHAQAESITYLVNTKFLTLMGDAQVEQNGDIYRSWKIEYDGMKDTVYSPPTDHGQTTIIIKGNEDVRI